MEKFPVLCFLNGNNLIGQCFPMWHDTINVTGIPWLCRCNQPVSDHYKPPPCYKDLPTPLDFSLAPILTNTLTLFIFSLSLWSYLHKTQEIQHLRNHLKNHKLLLFITTILLIPSIFLSVVLPQSHIREQIISLSFAFISFLPMSVFWWKSQEPNLAPELIDSLTSVIDDPSHANYLILLDLDR